MALRAEARAEPRLPLSRERVLDAAVRLADEAGIEALSMRRLGQALGVEAMSLYNHVANKDDLLDGMLELVAAEFELAAGDDWKRAVRRSTIAVHDALLRHRWACNLLVSRSTVTPVRLRQSESVLASLRRGGFSVELTHYAYHALESHIVGFTLWQLSFPFKTNEELLVLGRRFLAGLAVDEYPYFAEHVRHHLAPEHPEQSAFEFGLDLVLDGLERLRDS
jgi:AcrR family transcriptional regulator